MPNTEKKEGILVSKPTVFRAPPPKLLLGIQWWRETGDGSLSLTPNPSIWIFGNNGACAWFPCKEHKHTTWVSLFEPRCSSWAAFKNSIDPALLQRRALAWLQVLNRGPQTQSTRNASSSVGLSNPFQCRHKDGGTGVQKGLLTFGQPHPMGKKICGLRRFFKARRDLWMRNVDPVASNGHKIRNECSSEIGVAPKWTVNGKVD